MSTVKVNAVSVYADGIRLSCRVDHQEIGHAYLYLLRNDLHQQPFGFMEDVFIDDAHRGKGHGEALVQRVIDEAKRRSCYKLVAGSRHARDRVHALYAKLGFADHGKEFRIDFA